ncbi:MAG: sugar ABC transporter permease [Acidisphaera sp.]|nr:sugar ABC transporter permease [Acidisphaera sp.]
MSLALPLHAAGRRGWPGRGEAVFWLFALPFAALTVLFGLWPILLGIEVSFTDSATALRPLPRFVGFANYAAVLADPAFLQSLWRTLLYTGLAVAANVGFALLYALLLDSVAIGRGRTVLKLIAFLPVVTPDIAGYVVWRWLFDQSFGALNATLKLLGLPGFGGIASPGTAMLAVLLAELWHHAGLYVLIFLANLAICDRALSEAAEVDGARAWQRLLYVVLPQLRPALALNLVYALIQFLKTFTVVVVMTKGGPNGATNFVSYYAYEMFDQGNYGQATAMATLLFAIVLLAASTAWRLGEPGAA